MKPIRSIAITCIWTMFLFALLSPSTLHAQQLPPPESVRLDDLNYMAGFPPADDKIITNQNKSKYPQLRWTLQHTRELVPTRNIRRSASPVSALPVAERDLTAFAFEDDKSRPTTVGKWMTDTYTDVLVVLHKGKMIYERYHNQGADINPHLLFSMTKSITGLMAAQLVHDGRLDADALVPAYVPELAKSAWGDMTVRQVMDMTGAVRFREVYTDPTSEIFGYAFAAGMLPPPPNYTGPSTIYSFLQTLQKEGEHGAGFVYRTVHSEVLGWIISRVTGKHWADLMAEQIWQPLGMEEDAYVMIDKAGTPLQGAGLCAIARDLARFGEMVRRGGEFNGKRIFDQAVIDDLRKGGDREKFKASGMAFRPGYSYRSQWWILHNTDGAFEAAGIHGQMIHINPAAEMVVVKLSSHPVASAAFTHAYTLKAWDALASAVRLIK